MSNNRPEPTDPANYGREYVNKETIQRHQQSNYQNQSIFSCSFCQQSLPSSAALREHLLLCGNKTDECPKCRRLIRRSHFAYHYENNCAPIDQVETPPTGRQSRSTQRPPTNSNTPVGRVDIPNDDYRENHLGQNHSMHPQRVNDRIQLNPRNSPETSECEYCHQRYAQSHYKTHRDNCIRNPANMNHRQSPRIPLRPNQNQGASNGNVHVPCEICNQPVDIRNWSNHTQTCREQEKQRLQIRARSMSQEPVTEQLPCDYCQQLCSPKQLHSHEKNCLRNPDNMDSAANLARPRPGQRVFLPIKQKKDESHPASPNGRSPKRDVHYQSIDVDRTHEANRPFDNDRSNNRAGANQQPMRRTASNEILLQPQRDRSSKGRTLLHGKSFNGDEQNIEQNRYPGSDFVDNRSPYYNDRKPSHGGRRTDGTYEVIDNRPDRLATNRRKKSSWKAFWCGSNGVHD